MAMLNNQRVSTTYFKANKNQQQSREEVDGHTRPKPLVK